MENRGVLRDKYSTKQIKPGAVFISRYTLSAVFTMHMSTDVDLSRILYFESSFSRYCIWTMADYLKDTQHHIRAIS